MLERLEQTSADTNQTIQFRGTINVTKPIKNHLLKKVIKIDFLFSRPF